MASRQRSTPEQRPVSESQSPTQPPAQVTSVEVERAPSFRDACPECGGAVVADRHDTHCETCGLVVSEAHIDQGPTLADVGIGGPDGFNHGHCETYSLETPNPFRTDRNLTTTFSTKRDGYGNLIPESKQRTLQRLKTRQQRERFTGTRNENKRLMEGLRDVETIGGNLALPTFVCEDAARWVKHASEARLPAGHMAWESLAAGAITLAARNADLPRAPTEVAQYAKTTHERVCAAARKLRIELGLAVPPIRSEAVPAVLDALAADCLDGRGYLQLVVLGQHLMGLADDESIGPGTPRITVAASAVYAADRLTDDKWLTQPQVVAAASTIVEMSVSKLGRYSRDLFDAYVDHHGTEDPNVVLKRDMVRFR